MVMYATAYVKTANEYICSRKYSFADIIEPYKLISSLSSDSSSTRSLEAALYQSSLEV